MTEQQLLDRVFPHLREELVCMLEQKHDVNYAMKMRAIFEAFPGACRSYCFAKTIV